MRCERWIDYGNRAVQCKNVATHEVAYADEPKRVVFHFCPWCLDAFRTFRAGNKQVLEIVVRKMEAKDDESK